MLHYAWSHPNVRLANASISADQAAIIFNEIIEFAQRPKFSHWIESITKHPYPVLKLVNKAEIWSRSVGYEAELWRGFEFDWINVDEAAYVTREAAITTLKGRLLGVRNDGTPRAGIFTMTSSPKGKTWLFDRWKKGDPQYVGSSPSKYLSMRARTTDNIHLRKEDIEDLMRDYTERMIQQELEGLFLDSDTSVFPYEHVMATCDMERIEVRKLQEQVEKWIIDQHLKRYDEIIYYALPVEPDHIYLNSWDLGKKPTKTGRNAMVGCVVDITRKPWKLVGFRYAPGAKFGMAQEWIKEWHYQYSEGTASVETVIDATGKGDVVNEQLEEEERIQVEGIQYSGASKPQLVHSLQLALEKEWLVMPFIRRAVDQLQSYELPDDKIAQDIVMTLAQAAFRARQRAGEVSKVRAIEKRLIAPRKALLESDRFRLRRISERSRRKEK